MTGFPNAPSRCRAVRTGCGPTGCGRGGQAVETIKLEAELDATNQLELPDQNPVLHKLGLQPQIDSV